MTIEIEKNVPRPARAGSTRYPFAEMEVGDSFLFPSGTAPHTAYNAALYRSRGEKKFVSSKCADGMRCWRTA